MQIEVKPTADSTGKPDSAALLAMPVENKIDEIAKPVSSNKTAIIIAHGMGEQLKFETLNCVAQMIIRKHKDKVDSAVQLVKCGDKKIPRCELTMTGSSGNLNEVHLYEIYWAPITEGKITFWETLKFLFESNRTAMKYNFNHDHFVRRIFKSDKKFPIEKNSKVMLMVVMILLYFVLALFSASTFFVAAKLLTLIFDPYVFLSFFRSKLFNTFSIVSFILFVILLKPFSIIRRYVGDVAAYISPYKVSKFAKIREDIQETGMNLAKFVYGMTPGVELQYDRVFFAGHSLGSLIAYDTLNSIINENMADGESAAAGITKLLLTFGSPLDKTAFIFRTQKDNLPFREALSEATQPLINDYKYRPAKWINIYSSRDIVSGPLEYYDDPEMTKSDNNYSKRVLNIEDKQCKKFIAAHNEYWDTDLVADVLYREIMTKL